MSENTPDLKRASDSPSAGSPQRFRRVLRILLSDFWPFLRRVFSLSDGLDREGTMESIKRDVDFKGAAAWILIFSILIASIGLSVGNIPIIIGAMLISPLMGPILGIGLAAGINDFQLLKRSLVNLGISVIIGIVISAIYFLIIPIPEINIELRDRTQATLLAIGVAFFGGAAGIIASSRKQNNSVVPGVAIATALMPPLCTVGFGLATLQWQFFLGALYLFFINSVFIALPTYLYIRYMQFPMKVFIDPKRERRIRWRIATFLVITIVPSAFIFVHVLKTSFFESDSKRFVSAVEQTLTEINTTMIDYKILNTEEEQVIKIALIGDPIDQSLRTRWVSMLSDYGLEEVTLDIREPRDYSQAIEEMRSENRMSSMDQMRGFYESQIETRDSTIRSLQITLDQTIGVFGDFNLLTAEVKSLYPDLERVAFANFFESDFSGDADTIPTLMVNWQRQTPFADRRLNAERLSSWLEVRLKRPVRVVNFFEGINK
jgi:uncharacterized hydrophobic protein (TIGR00271 family)